METKELTLEEAIELINEEKHRTIVFFGEGYSADIVPFRANMVYPDHEKSGVLLISKEDLNDCIHISKPHRCVYFVRYFDHGNIEISIHTNR